MHLSGLKVGIIGGSIAGCAAASALLRGGCDVQVFERSSAALKDRGSGIAIPGPLRAQLVEQGYLPADYPVCTADKRWWQLEDGTHTGRTIWVQPTPAVTNNWGNLWRNLRTLVPDARYHEGMGLAAFQERADGVEVEFTDGSRQSFDLIVGADGYKSAVRAALHPDVAPEFANYVLWRGNYPESEVADRSLIDALDREKAWMTVAFPGGHGVMYMIPNFDGGNVPGRRRVNWAIYAPCPKALTLSGVESIPPGSVTPEVYATLDVILTDHFPPAMEALIRGARREDVSIQPIYDAIVNSYTSARTLLIGDAGSVTRPHTASGATKALEDALALETLATQATSLDALLEGYDSARCEAAKTLCEIGRRIGHAQVTHTPDWGAMREKDFEDWVKATLAGKTLYLYGEKA